MQAELEADGYVKISAMKKFKKRLRCRSIRRAKNEFNRRKQRFLCRDHEFNYTCTKMDILTL